MKKSMNISFILLIALSIVLSTLLSCKNMQSSRRTDLVEPEGLEMLSLAQTRRPMIAAPVSVKTVSDRPNPVVENETGQLKLSRVYPDAQFALVQMDKTMPKEVGLKKPFDYSIEVTNLTCSTLPDVVITEKIPENFKYTGSEPTAKVNADSLVWKINSLAPKASEQIVVSGMATDIDSLGLSTTVVTHCVPLYADLKVIQPRLEFIQTAPSQVLLCDMIPVQFVVTNTGTGTARSVKIVDELDRGLQTADGQNELVIDVGTVKEGQSRKFTAKLRATRTGKYVSEAVASASGLEDMSQATTIFVGQPELEVQKTGSKRQYVGRPVTYEITVTNKSDALARNTIIEDTIPPGVSSIKASAGAKLSRSRKIVWQLGNLEPGASKAVQVSYIPTKIGTMTDETTVSAYCAEQVTASAETAISGISGILLEVVDLEDPVEVGESTMYEITVTNQGSAPATGINISCVLEDNVRYVSTTGATAGSMEANLLKFAPLASLAPKSRATWRIIVNAVKPADTRFRVIMNADQLTRPVEETEATHLYE